MKKTTSFALAAAAAALFSFASPTAAGILTVTMGPTFTPPDDFTNNTIMADMTVEGGFVHLVGGATITPDASNLATIDISGTYSAGAGELFSVAYSFTANLNLTDPVPYTLTATAMVFGTPVTFTSTGMLMPGLHEYTGAAQSPPFPTAAAGDFSGTLELDFSNVGPTAPIVAGAGAVDLNIAQIDFKLDTTAATVAAPSQPQNVSTRGNVGTGADVLIGGFIITGNDSKLVVLRAIGPSISPQDVPSPLLDPILELHDSTGAIIDTNDNWGDNSDADQAILRDNNLAPTKTMESALVETLAPGKYTAIVRGAGDTTGVALVEAYDLDAAGTTDSKLANISTRGNVGTEDDVLIGGFIVGGGGGGFSPTIIRGLGPSIAGGDITAPLADPVLELHDADGNVLDTNDNWMDNPDMQTISDDGLAPSDPNEAALYEILLPGNYTAILSGANNTTGIGLVEVYNVEP